MLDRFEPVAESVTRPRLAGGIQNGVEVFSQRIIFTLQQRCPFDSIHKNSRQDFDWEIVDAVMPRGSKEEFLETRDICTEKGEE